MTSGINHQIRLAGRPVRILDRSMTIFSLMLLLNYDLQEYVCGDSNWLDHPLVRRELRSEEDIAKANENFEIAWSQPRQRSGNNHLEDPGRLEQVRLALALR